jgi:hypothetical protein
MPTPPSPNSSPAEQTQLVRQRRALNRLLPTLQRGMRSEVVNELAFFVLKEAHNMSALLSILKHPESYPKIQIQKAAWVAHRAFQTDSRGLLGHRQAFSQILDASEDPSVMREILKVLANPVWLDIENESMRAELLQLAVDLLHLPHFPIAVHYAALQIIQTRVTNKAEEIEAIAAIQSLMDDLQDTKALYQCAAKHKAHILQKIRR